MSFFLGLAFSIVILTWSIFLGVIQHLNIKDFGLPLILGLMFLGDGVLAGIYYFAVVDMAEILKPFKLGMSASFALTSIIRAIIFLLPQLKELKFQS